MRDLVARIDDDRLRVYEGAQCKVVKEHKGERAELEAELEKLVARRTKGGWSLESRIESPWQPWLHALERRHEHVIAHAKTVGVSVKMPSFQVGYPRGASRELSDAWSELFRLTSIVRLTWYLEGAPRSRSNSRSGPRQTRTERSGSGRSAIRDSARATPAVTSMSPRTRS
jgi:hypothetical protein